MQTSRGRNPEVALGAAMWSPNAALAGGMSLAAGWFSAAVSTAPPQAASARIEAANVRTIRTPFS